MEHATTEDVWIYTGQDKEVPETVRRIKIAENITRIPDEAFIGHQELDEVTFSSSVQVIGKLAFRGCIKLKSILYQTVGEEAKIGIPSYVREIDNCAFYECQLLEGPGLCEGLERIGNCAFFACKSLTEVEIPSTVTEIGDGAFHKCKRLGRLGLNEGLERIGKRAFFQCESLTGANVPSTVKVIDDVAFDTCKSLGRLVLNEGLERIGGGAFRECYCLTEVEIPSTVKVIGDWAFEYCTSLGRLVLNEGLERIGEYAFFDCRSLTEVEIPSTVKVIDDHTFRECKLLARLGLNEGLERIGKLAFCACDSLSRVGIRIATNAFINCRDLVSIELPEECPFNINLSGCRSLVSLAGQISILFQDERRREEFFQSSKLGCLVDDEADLKRKLNHRFDNSPVNKLCYYQSYQSSDDSMAQLRSLMEKHPPLAATTQVDEFGMTPLHVLSLSQTTNLDMLLAVMDAGKLGHMVRVRDSFGSTPMDYLCMNRMPNSTEVIRRLFQTRYDQVLGSLEPFWKSAMLQSIEEILAGDWSLRKSKIGRVTRKYERKEILSLVELCLWKMKIDEVTEQIVDRQRCRIMSGAAVVMPHLLPFLDQLDKED
eukprot:scaffold892_cov104-Cylindrotheca_fusiformis.AAC.1